MSFRRRDDLDFQVTRAGATRIYLNLEGAACDRCGFRAFLSEELARLHIAQQQATRPDYQARITTIGRGSLGTYWPNDLVRVLGLTKGVNLFIEVLDDQTAILRVRH